MGTWVPTVALGPALLLKSHEPRDMLGASKAQWSPLVAPLARGAHSHLQLLWGPTLRVRSPKLLTATRFIWGWVAPFSGS